MALTLRPRLVQCGSCNSVQRVALAMFARIFTLALFAQPRCGLHGRNYTERNCFSIIFQMIGAGINSLDDINASVTAGVDAKRENRALSCEGTRISIIVP